MTQESLEHKCCIPECKGHPSSVMTAKSECEVLSFYACKRHEPAVWKHMARTYKNKYSMELKNIITNTEE